MEDERKAWALACEGFEQIEQNLSTRIDLLESTICVALGYLITGQTGMAKIVLGAIANPSKMPQERSLAPVETFLPPKGDEDTLQE